jgi:DNA polymerase III subunit epsilon
VQDTRAVPAESDAEAAGAGVTVAVHTESTGGRSERRRLLWVGLTRVCGGRIEETLETLVNPQTRIPQHVVQRLGLDLEALCDARPASDVLAEVRDFIGHAAIAGHNVREQLSQLNYELLWHGHGPIENALVDTQELAASHMPEVARPTLAAASKALGVPTARGALAGVSRQVADVFLALEARAAHQPGAPAERLERALRALPAGASDLPELPGVYVFRDAAGTPLYVGKAASLRARVAQHFAGVSRAVRRDDGLLGRVRRVEHQVTSCELEALLRESALIEAWAPPYNTQRTAHGTKAFLQLRGAPFARATPRADFSLEEGPCYGPFATSRAVRDTMTTLARVFQLRTCLRKLPAKRKALRQPCIRLGQALCPAPCAALVTPEQYAMLVELAQLFLDRGREATLDALDARLVEHSQPGGWEEDMLREVRSRLRRTRKEHRQITGGTSGGRTVLAYPASEGGYVAYFVEGGALIARRHVADELELDAATGTWPEQEPDAVLSVSQRNVLLRWLHQHQAAAIRVS